jgi:hypothetical protein
MGAKTVAGILPIGAAYRPPHGFSRVNSGSGGSGSVRLVGLAPVSPTARRAWRPKKSASDIGRSCFGAWLHGTAESRRGSGTPSSFWAPADAEADALAFKFGCQRFETLPSKAFGAGAHGGVRQTRCFLLTSREQITAFSLKER